MCTNRRRLNCIFIFSNSISHNGFTLLEVTVVGLVVGLICAIAFPSWLAFVERQKVRFAAEQLRGALFQAKSEGALRSVRYAVTVCSNSLGSGQLEAIKYSVHAYSERPYLFTTIEGVSLVQSTIKRSPRGYNLVRFEDGDCYTTYLGLFPGDGYALGFFYVSNRQQTFVYCVGFNTLIGNVVSCPIVSLKRNYCR